MTVTVLIIGIVVSFFAGVIAGFWVMSFFVLGKKDEQRNRPIK